MAQSAEYVGVAECFCGEGPKDADWLALACGHVAHEECLERWAEGKTAPCCPSCREPAPELKKKSKARRLKLFLTNQDQGSLFASSQAPSNDERIEKFRDLLRRERAHALELQQSLIKAQCSIADHEAQCKQQDAKVAKYRADKSEAVLQLAVLQGTIQKLTAELGQVQTELAQERKQHVNSVQQLSKEKSELQGRMSKLETSLRSMQFKLNQQQVRSNPQMSREDIQRLLCTQAGEEVLDGLAESALAELLVERTREVQAVQQRSEALRRRHQEQLGLKEGTSAALCLQELQVLKSAAADMKRAAEQEQVRLRQENDRCRLELTAMEVRAAGRSHVTGCMHHSTQHAAWESAWVVQLCELIRRPASTLPRLVLYPWSA
ncbi:hypothetical protein QJQ45_021764 [Haematococcus lacustris]|nr:hypothetical protein QJQ45_021764 [Haematococcus lacustris]